MRLPYVAAAAVVAIVGGADAPSLAAPRPILAAPYTPAPARVPTTGATLKLGKCINLSNMLEAPTEGGWGRAFQDADMDRIRAKGFTGLRLPVRFSAHAGSAPPYTIDPAFLARVHHIVDLATARDIAVIVDMHHYEELFADPAAHAARFVALWRQVATSFKDAPASVYFEAINEPHDKLTAPVLKAMLPYVLAAIRETNPTRPVVIDGPMWASLDEMRPDYLPADANLVPTFHWYKPDNFGLDKATYMTPQVKKSWGDGADIAELNGGVAKAKAYMDATGRVPFMGEYGAFDARPADQRTRYYATVSAAFASAGVQSCAWGYDNTYNLFRDGRWFDAAVDNIVTTTAQ